MKLFISYPHDEIEYVQQLVDGLQDETGNHAAWYDSRILGGDEWWNEILTQIENAECFICVLTKSGVDSIFCIAELKYALELNKPILPIKLHPCEIPENLTGIQYITVDTSVTDKSLRRLDKALAKIELDVLKSKYVHPKDTPPRPLIPVAKTYPEYIDISQRLESVSKHTKRAYEYWIRQFLCEVGGLERETIDLNQAPLEQIKNVLVNKTLSHWLSELKQNGAKSQTMVQAKSSVVWLARILSDLGWLDQLIVASLSMVKTPSAVDDFPVARVWLTESQIKHLLDGLKYKAANSSIDTRNYAFVMLMATCFLSREEITRTNWTDISVEDSKPVLTVHGKGGKTRRIKIPAIAYRALNNWRSCHPDPEGDKPIFTRIWKGGLVTTGSFTDRNVWSLIKNAASAAGLPHVSSEGLRRSCARAAYEAKVPIDAIQYAMGHSTPQFTANYLEVNLSVPKDGIEVWAKRLE